MKNTIKYIALGFSLLASMMVARAQNDGVSYHSDNGVSTNKSVDSNGKGGYTITLETFATGSTAQIYSSTPVDIILVLDTSYSMEQYDYTYDEDGRTVTRTRLAALKYAVGKFVDEIARNDKYDDDNKEREKLLGNRIQVITFNSSATVLFDGFQPAYDNAGTIKSTVNGLGTRTSTRQDLGMNTASTWVNTSKNATYWTTNNLKTDNDHNIVVVMFTDGCPATQNSTAFVASYAAATVNTARTIKNNGATVYSVGLIDWSALSTAIQGYVRNMMDYSSSNFPEGSASYTGTAGQTGGTLTCTGTREDTQYYADANEVKLADIFESIAQASGGSAAQVGTATQVRDVVSSSFIIPSGFTADKVTLEVYDIDADGNGWTLDEDYDLTDVEPVIGTNSDGNSTLVVEGFDYSSPDTKDANGYTTRENAGNWVGQRYKSKTETFWAGKKLVIKFDIDAQDGVTGGDATQTNASGSGVWVRDPETGEYRCVNEFIVPVADLPVNIKIQKNGLRHGESATFQIFKIAPLRNDDGEIQYNAIGKPLPAEKEYTPKEGDDAHDILEGKGWEPWSKVILTNKGANGAMVTKTLLSLDPGWIYSVTEDDWGWAYTLTGTVDGVVVEEASQNTSTVAVNPFTFTNKEKTDVVKHAEAVTINHFGYTIQGGEFDGKQVETYKSSKVKTF